MKRTIKVEESAFKYDPTSREMTVIAGLRFVYRSGAFRCDANHQGEEDLVAIDQVRKEGKVLGFSAEGNGEKFDLELIGDTEVDELLFDAIAHFDGVIGGSDNDLDKIELTSRQGRLSTLYVYKNLLRNDAYELLDALRVIREADGLFLIRQRPFRKTRIHEVQLRGNTVVCRMENSEGHGFPLDVDEAVLGMVEKIFSRLKK
jgi:hypothetical protein